MQLIKIPIPTETVQVKIPKRKHSRRWQKKYLKKYGTKVIVLPHNREDILYDEQNDITYAYPDMYYRLKKELENLRVVAPPFTSFERDFSGWI